MTPFGLRSKIKTLGRRRKRRRKEELVGQEVPTDEEEPTSNFKGCNQGNFKLTSQLSQSTVLFEMSLVVLSNLLQRESIKSSFFPRASYGTVGVRFCAISFFWQLCWLFEYFLICSKRSPVDDFS